MIKIILIIMAVFILYCMIETARELRDFRLTKYRICSPKLNGIRETKKIVFLSDLHNRMYGKENERLLESIKNQHPDLILIGGDMLVRKDGNSYDRTVRFLEKLPAICPVYCANGNHEQKLKELPDKYEQSYEGYKKALTACGIYMLENASETVRLDEAPVRISGLEIWKERPSVKRDHRPYRRARRGISDPACTSSRIYTGISGIWSRSDTERTLSRGCDAASGDRRGDFTGFYTISKIFRRNIQGRSTDGGRKPRTGNTFCAGKIVELAGTDRS